MDYFKLLEEAENEGIEILESSHLGRVKGLYVDDTITLNTSLKTLEQKKCILAEELSHYYTSFGDIRDQSKVENRKQEIRARAWGYERLIGIMDLVRAYKAGISGRYELAEFLEVTEEYIIEALEFYKGKYGDYYRIDHYMIYFDPLIVLEEF